MSTDQPAFIKQLPRRPGQKEVRYMHLFAGDIEAFEEEYVAEESSSSKSNHELETRLAKVEEELAELKIAFDQLMKELMG